MFTFFGILSSTTCQVNEKDNQWWIGFKTGTNQSNPSISKSFEVLTNSMETEQIKNYNIKQGWGYHVGFVGTWDFLNDLNVSLQPYFSSQKLAYSKNYQWQTEPNSLIINDQHHITLNHIHIPLFLRYEIPFPKLGNGMSGKLKKKSTYSMKPGSTKKQRSKTIPYIQAGFYYSRLLSANNQVTRTETTNGFEENPSEELIGITSLFNRGTVGFNLGAGASYDIGGSFRVALDLTYNQGLNNLANQKNRYSNQKMSLKYFDSLDDMRLQNWNIALHFLFPLKFVYSGNYQSI